jgi:hypothetical protein
MVFINNIYLTWLRIMKEGDRVSLFRSFQILFWCWGLIEPSIYPDKNYLRAKLVSYDLSSGSDIGLI